MGLNDFYMPPTVNPPAIPEPPDTKSLPAFKDTNNVLPNMNDSVVPPPPDIQGMTSGELNAPPAPDITSLSIADRAGSAQLSVGSYSKKNITLAGITRTNAKGGVPGHINTGMAAGYRHFSFVLNNKIDGVIPVVDLNINPEDLTIETPYRVNAVQTMGGAFADLWGQGIKRITMRGTTGWRTVQMPAQIQDGYDNFKSLKEQIFDTYHKLRNDNALKYSNSELDDKIRLTLVDRLHGTAYRVIPDQFKALRNKQRPLLHMYEVSFIVIDDDKETFATYSKNQDANLAGLFGELANQGKGLQDKAAKAGKLQGFINTLGKGIQKVGQTMQTVMKAKNEVMNSVAATAQKYNECVQAVRSGIGMIQSVADLSTLDLATKSILWDTKSVYKQADLLLSQVKSGGMFTYTGVVGSTYAPAPFSQGYGMPPVASTTNTFEALKSTSNSKLNSITDSISLKSRGVTDKINNIDTSGMLLKGK